MHCYSSLIIGAPGNDNKQTYKFAVILNYKGHTNFSYSFQNNLFCFVLISKLHGPFVYMLLYVYSLRMSMKIHFSILEFRIEPVEKFTIEAKGLCSSLQSCTIPLNMVFNVPIYYKLFNI